MGMGASRGVIGGQEGVEWKWERVGRRWGGGGEGGGVRNERRIGGGWRRKAAQGQVGELRDVPH